MNNRVRKYEYNDRREAIIRRNRIRRERQLRKHLFIALATFVIVLSVAFSMTSFLSKAQEIDVKEKCFTSVMVPYGSSLSELAEEYIDNTYYDSMNDYLNEVAFINHLYNLDDIRAGEYIVLPYYS